MECVCFPVFVLSIKYWLQQILGWKVFFGVFCPDFSPKIKQKAKNSSLIFHGFLHFFFLMEFIQYSRFSDYSFYKPHLLNVNTVSCNMINSRVKCTDALQEMYQTYFYRIC